MKKNNLINIAKAVYLQDRIAKQLFAQMYNPNKIINNELGSLSGVFGNVADCFQYFIGSNSNKVQFVEKNGDNFNVYGFGSNSQPNLKGNYVVIKSFYKLNLYLQQNNSRLTKTHNSLSQKLKVFLTLINEQKASYIVKEYGNADKIKDIKDETSLKDEAKNIIDEWIRDITVHIKQIQKFQKSIPLLFMNNNSNQIANIINGLPTIVNETLNGYKEKINNFGKYNLNSDDNNGLNAVIDKVISSLKQKGVLTQIREMASKRNTSDSQQSNNFNKIKNAITNTTEHVYRIFRFIEALQNEKDNVYADYILKSILTSNTSEKIKKDWQQSSESINKIMEKNQIYYSQDLPSTTQEIQTSLNSFVSFLNKQQQSKGLRSDTWAKVLKFLKISYKKQAQKLKVIDYFDELFNFVMQLQPSDEGTILYKMNQLNKFRENRMVFVYNAIEAIKKTVKLTDQYRSCLNELQTGLNNGTLNKQMLEKFVSLSTFNGKTVQKKSDDLYKKLITLVDNSIDKQFVDSAAEYGISQQDAKIMINNIYQNKVKTYDTMPMNVVNGLSVVDQLKGLVLHVNED